MPVEEIASTFEFTCDWLVSSALVVEHLLKDGPDFGDDPTRFAAAKARIACEDLWIAPNPDNEGEDAPAVPSPIRTIPRILIKTRRKERRRVATGTWAQSGTLVVVFWLLAPEEYRPNHATDTAQQLLDKFEARRAWAQRLGDQIANELEQTSGRSDEDGNPYLNAQRISVEDMPMDLDQSEDADGVGFEMEVEWQ